MMTKPTAELIERCARALERARNPQWTDEEFETWWNRDPFFCEQRTSWGHFSGTRKEHCLWEAEQVLVEASRTPANEPLPAVEGKGALSAQETVNVLAQHGGALINRHVYLNETGFWLFMAAIEKLVKARGYWDTVSQLYGEQFAVKTLGLRP